MKSALLQSSQQLHHKVHYKAHGRRSYSSSCLQHQFSWQFRTAQLEQVTDVPLISRSGSEFSRFYVDRATA
ncbi:hypothetical protein [Phormidesmis sp. 146-33]